jgi:hypothetical protein
MAAVGRQWRLQLLFHSWLGAVTQAQANRGSEARAYVQLRASFG